MGCLQVPPSNFRAPGAWLRFTALGVPSIRLVGLMKRVIPRTFRDQQLHEMFMYTVNVSGTHWRG